MSASLSNKQADWLTFAQGELEEAGVPSARLDSLLLLEKVTQRNRASLLTDLAVPLDDRQQRELGRLLRRRARREPMAYILGHKEFYGREFLVNPNVLIPRPETEQIVVATLDILGRLSTHKPRVLEIGTGSGAIAVTLKAERPEWDVTATDISKAALGVAATNARRQRASINFIQSDLFRNVTGRYDLIVANLPYVATTARVQPELKYEPAQALFSGGNGLAHYERLLPEVATYLLPGASLLLEADPVQHPALTSAAERHGLTATRTDSFVFSVAG